MDFVPDRGPREMKGQSVITVTKPRCCEKTEGGKAGAEHVAKNKKQKNKVSATVRERVREG